jgi:acyl-[acyl-carrier-protein]-phospholipid O-acyltransferase/long-chain-fatty-acid--[acyl-carrier-protein] ligase
MFCSEVKMRQEQGDIQEVRAARGRFLAMAATYFLGVFNDNFFKQAALLLAVVAGLSGLQGTATALFSLPFILFSAYGGWLADRYSKRQVIIGVKILEVVAMVLGAYGVYTMNWTWILAMVFLMGLQSTFFGPALNGSIPELYPSWYVTKANALLKLVTTVAILLGMATAGIALDQQWFDTEVPFGRLLVCVVVLSVALLGLLAAFGIKRMKGAGSHSPFPWSGPLVSLQDSINLRHDPLLLLAVLGDTFFYFFSLLAVMVINTLGISELLMTKTQTSLLSVSLMVGVCIGSLIAARITSCERWSHVLGPACFGMGLCLLGTGIVAQMDSTSQWTILLLTLLGAGAFGGIFLIPLTSFVQVRPKDNQKGKVIAAANFCAFSGMLIAGKLFTLFAAAFQPSRNMIILGGTGVMCAFLFYLGSMFANRYEKNAKMESENV